MANRKFELDVGVVKTKLQSIWADEIWELDIGASREDVQIFSNRFVNSHFKEMERQSRMSAEALDLARDRLRIV